MMKLKFLLTLPLLALLIVSMGACEFEPVELVGGLTRAEAYEIELDRTYRTRIRTNDEDRWFRFTTAHGEDTYDRVQISVTEVDVDLKTRLELYGPDGASLDSHGANTGGQNLTYSFATVGSSFFIRFSGWNGIISDHSSSGSFSFRVENLDENDEYGPNHTRADAHPIDLATDYEGVLVSRYEADWFVFTTAHGEETYDRIEMSVTDVGPDLKVRMELFDFDGNSIFSRGTSTNGQGLTSTLSSRGGTFYLRISGWNGIASDHASAGEYTLRVDNLDANDAYGPNHEMVDAYSMELATDYEGVLVSQYENDWYVFTTAHGEETYDRVQIGLTETGSELKVHFELYDEDGNSLMSRGASTEGQSVTSSFASLGGTFYLRISGWNGIATDNSSAGEYTLRVENLNANDPYGPNHEMVDAYPVNLATDYDGVLVSRYEDDWYVFTTVHAADTYDEVRIDLTNVGAELKVHLELYDDAGNSIHRSGASTNGQSFSHSFAPLGGRFYLRISGWNGIASDHASSGEYTLRVENLDSNDPYGPNHVIDDAHPVVYETDYQGVLVSRHEADYYSFVTEHEHTLISITDVGQDLRIRLELFDSNKQSLWSGGVSTSGQNYQFELTNAGIGQTFYIRLSGWNGIATDHSTSGPYTFRLTELQQ